jgi:hypothetical protein
MTQLTSDLIDKILCHINSPKLVKNFRNYLSQKSIDKMLNFRQILISGYYKEIGLLKELDVKCDINWIFMIAQVKFHPKKGDRSYTNKKIINILQNDFTELKITCYNLYCLGPPNGFKGYNFIFKNLYSCANFRVEDKISIFRNYVLNTTTTKDIKKLIIQDTKDIRLYHKIKHIINFLEFDTFKLLLTSLIKNGYILTEKDKKYVIYILKNKFDLCFNCETGLSKHWDLK